MADSANRKVIAYVADIADVKAKLRELASLNKSAANVLGKDFATNLKQVSKGYAKLGDVEVKKLSTDMKGLIGTTTETSSVMKDANGQFVKLTKTVSIFGKKNKDGVITPFQKTSVSVKNASESIKKYSKNMSPLIGKSSQLKSNLQSVTDVNQKFAKQLTRSGNAVRVVSTDLKQTSGNITKFGTVVKTADGKFLHLRETVQKTPLGLQKVSRSVQDVTKKYQGYNTVSKKASTNSVSLLQNMARLAKRALLTIPIWFALRGAISGVTNTFKNGIKAINAQDEAFQKAKRNIQGTTASITKNYKTLREEALKLSLETGESVESITNAFQKFATVGFDFETSMQGASSAVKLAILLFGESTETANAFARSMRVLVDRSDDTADAGTQISEAMALTGELWKTNAFEVNEFTQDLEKFAGTAKTTNITTKETIALLSTLSTAGLRKRGGRLLRTSINKLLSNLDNLASQLNVSVNPKIDSTFSVLMKVITALEGLQKTSGSLGPTTKIIGEIFGGVRGAEVVRALIALRTELNKNLAVTGDLVKFNKEFENQNEQIHRLAKQFSNLGKESGKAFVVGVVGGENYQQSLKKIVDMMQMLPKLAEKSGRLTFGAFNPSLIMKEMINDIIGKKLHKAIAISAEVAEKAGASFSESYLKALKGNLSTKDIKSLLMRASTFGAEALQLDEGTLDTTVTKLKEILKVQQQIEKQEKIAKDNLAPSLDPATEEEIAKTIRDSAIERIKAEGAIHSQVLKTISLTNQKLGIEEKTIEKLNRQLSIEQAINNEKKLQSKLGGDSVKLFQIAQEHGNKVSEQIGDVLQGNVDFSDFVRRGGDALDIFKKEFSSKFEQAQAEQFFKGERVSGKPGLRGGDRIAIDEKSIRGVNLSNVALAYKKAMAEYQKLEGTQMGLTSASIQELQIKRATIELVNLPIGGGLQNSGMLSNALIQSTPQGSNPNTLTNANLSRFNQSPQNAFNVNFSAGSFIIHGSPDDATQEAIKNSITSALRDFQNKIVGKQSPTI